MQGSYISPKISEKDNMEMHYNDKDMMQIAQATYLQNSNLLYINAIEEHLMKSEETFKLVDLLKDGLIFIAFVLFWPIFLLMEMLEPKMKVKYLMSEWNQTDHYGDSLHCQDYYSTGSNIDGNIDGLEMLMHINRNFVIFHAIESDHLDILSHLLDQNMDLSFENMDHMTPLMHAVSLGKENVVELLLEQDSSAINMGDSYYGRVPIAFCRTQKSLTLGMVQLLCSYGADVNLVPDLLLCASRRTSDEGLVKFILQQNPSSDMINRRLDIRGVVILFQ